MIKAVVKIHNRFGEDQTMDEFLKAVYKGRWKMKMPNDFKPNIPSEEEPVRKKGHLLKKRIFEYDEVGRPYVEITHIFEDRVVAKRTFENEKTLKNAERLKKMGYDFTVKYYDIPTNLEKEYLESYPDLTKTESVPEKLDEIKTI